MTEQVPSKERIGFLIEYWTAKLGSHRRWPEGRGLQAELMGLIYAHTIAALEQLQKPPHERESPHCSTCACGLAHEPNAATPRAGFEKWLHDSQGLSSEWQAERNCYKDFPAHLAWCAWRDSRTAREPGVIATAALIEPGIELPCLRCGQPSEQPTHFAFLIKRPRDKEAWATIFTDCERAEAYEHRASPVVPVRLACFRCERATQPPEPPAVTNDQIESLLAALDHDPVMARDYGIVRRWLGAIGAAQPPGDGG